jgi:hypothetical protein
MELVYSFIEKVSHRETRSFRGCGPIDLPLFKVKMVEMPGVIGHLIEYNEDMLDRFAVNQKGIGQESIRTYRRLHKSLSLDNGPWSTPEVVQCVYSKLRNSIFKCYLRIRMKPNLRFQDHRDASLARDLGSLETATQIYKTEQQLRRANQFNADFVLTQFEEDEAESERLQAPEKVRQKYAAEMITPKCVHTGTVWFTDTELFFDSPTRTIEIPISRIRKIFLRRWLHSDTALELFMSYAKVFFLNFSEGQRRMFLKRLLAQKPARLKYCQKTAAEAKQLALKATKKWQRGHLSNFDYLMKLNLYAGRSYNDLSQYPVFPWVLKDYWSPHLALNSSAIYRDFSLPIGAVNAERLKLICQDHEGPGCEENFLFGSLYSSSAMVIGYLIRIEPFTSLHISLQSGRFDHPDRLFSSIPDCWRSVCSLQPDYRELIPEFFNFPDFLINDNKFDFGVLSTNVPVGDVSLPAWAKSPVEFIDLHRTALESKFVTAKLNRWIDLIFGPSANGERAVAARNTFHPYFYHTVLTPKAKNDPLDLQIIQEYARCFGSVPSQLFDEAPPPRIFYVKNFGREFLPQSQSTRQFTSLFVNGKLLLAVTQTLDFTIFKHREEISKGHIDFLYPTAAGLFPFLSITRSYAAVCFPSCPRFHIFTVKNGHCPLIYIAKGHTRPITSLVVFKKWVLSASEDYTLRLWPINSQSKHQTIRVPHTRPIVLMKTRALFQEVITISADGFLAASSLITRQYLKGVQLGRASPSGMIISASGLIVVTFRGPGSFLIVIVGVNLDIQTEVNIDGTLTCWTVVLLNGMDYLVLVIGNRITFFRLPMLVKVGEMRITFQAIAMAFVKKDRMLYIASADKTLLGLNVGRIVMKGKISD